jgi:uncharacterized membrane protein
MTTKRARYGVAGAVSGKAGIEEAAVAAAAATIGQWVTSLAIILLLLAIGAMIGYAARAYAGTPEPHRDIHAAAQIPAAEKRWIEQRHKYHGIYASIEENGERYFYRDGKKCKL